MSYSILPTLVFVVALGAAAFAQEQTSAQTQTEAQSETELQQKPELQPKTESQPQSESQQAELSRKMFLFTANSADQSGDCQRWRHGRSVVRAKSR